MSKKKQVGLFFGSFNPVHYGHLIIAGYILEHSYLDELWFVVSPQNPLKEKGILAPDHLRFEMVKQSIPDNCKIKVCDIEIDLPKPSYTIDTLRILSEKYPKNEFIVIMGSDSNENISKWKDYLQILDSYKIIVYPRKGFKNGNQKLSKNIEFIEAPIVELSSTMIRKTIHSGKDISFFVPAGAVKIIRENNLYK